MKVFLFWLRYYLWLTTDIRISDKIFRDVHVLQPKSATQTHLCLRNFDYLESAQRHDILKNELNRLKHLCKFLLHATVMAVRGADIYTQIAVNYGNTRKQSCIHNMNSICLPLLASLHFQHPNIVRKMLLIKWKWVGRFHESSTNHTFHAVFEKKSTHLLRSTNIPE